LRRNKVKALQRRLEYRIFAKHFCRKCKNYTRWQCFPGSGDRKPVFSARELGLSPALVSRRIAALEARLGVRLLIAPPAACGSPMKRELPRHLLPRPGRNRRSRRRRGRGPRRAARRAESRHPGVLRNRHIAPLIPAFAARYPKVQLALSLSDRAVNIIEEASISPSA